jgi:hypothetical protein
MLCSKIVFGVRHERHSGSLAALLIGLSYGVSVGAHDFWVQPAEYWLRPEVASSMTLQVGHGAFRQRSPLPSSRITRFEAIASDGTAIDLRGTLHVGGSADDGTLKFSKPGTYVLVLETDSRAQSHLPAIRFNDYLKVEGLTPALEQRARTHRMAGALVKLTNLEHDAAPLEVHLTDNMGRASFTMPKDGTWLLNVIWTKALPSSRDTDFETIFSSLSLGFPSSRP